MISSLDPLTFCCPFSMPGNILGPQDGDDGGVGGSINATLVSPLATGSGGALKTIDADSGSLLSRMLKYLKIIAMHLSLISGERINKGDVTNG